MGLDLFFSFPTLKGLIMILAIIAGIFVIATKNAIISVFNLIVLYILVAFYLIYIGITYLGISYIIVYIGAIAILFLFVIMMIDIEVVEKKNNNYLPLLFFLLGGFLFTLKNILYNLGIVKIKSLLLKVEDKLLIDEEEGILFNFNPRSQFNIDKLVSNYNIGNDYDFSNLTLFDEFSNSNDLLNSFGINHNILDRSYEREFNYEISSSFVNKYDFKDTDFILNNVSSKISSSNYLLIIPDWNSALSRVTQISAIGDVLYTVYHSYIYIVSVILLLGMVGAIILTAEQNHHTRVINIEKPFSSIEKESNLLMNNLDIKYPKNSSILAPLIMLNKFLYSFVFSNYYSYKNLIEILKKNNSFINILLNVLLIILFNIVKYIKNFNSVARISPRPFGPAATYWIRPRSAGPGTEARISNLVNLTIIQKIKFHTLRISGIGIYPFFDILNNENNYSEGVAGTLMYYIISNIIIGLLLLFINSSFSLSVKYLEKGGGFECGFTSFVQTRERYNIIFYRVSLLFLIFDLEIILAFPYSALYQKNQNMSKNNVLVFLYILVVGFIYELKEGALNIVKTPHHSEINVKL